MDYGLNSWRNGFISLPEVFRLKANEYIIGTVFNRLLIFRESKESWASRKEAEIAFITGKWTQFYD